MTILIQSFFTLFLLSITTAGFTKEIKLAPNVTIAPIINEDIYDIYYYPALLTPHITYSHFATFNGNIVQNFKKIGDIVKQNEVIFKVQPHNPSYQQVELKAPSSGTIIKVAPKNKGTFLLGDLLYEVSDLSQFQLDFQVPAEEKSLLINQNSILELIVDDKTLNVSDLTFDIKLTSFGTIESSCQVSQTEDRELTTGKIYNLRLTTGQRKAYLLPPSAIKYERQSTYVYTVENNKIKKVPVTLSHNMYNGMYEVLSKVDSSMQILFDNYRYLTDGQEISLPQIHSAN